MERKAFDSVPKANVRAKSRLEDRDAIRENCHDGCEESRKKAPAPSHRWLLASSVRPSSFRRTAKEATSWMATIARSSAMMGLVVCRPHAAIRRRSCFRTGPLMTICD